jgi:hypothetical protein
MRTWQVAVRSIAGFCGIAAQSFELSGETLTPKEFEELLERNGD